MSDVPSRMASRRPWRHLGLAALAMVLGVVAITTPLGRAWEQDFGLTWLFQLRGPVAPPRDVVVVTIDRESSERLGLPNNPRKWPRDLHGRLVDRLTQAGASVIAFDVQFQDPQETTADRAFADAVRRAGNVILFDYLEKEIRPLAVDGASRPSNLFKVQRIPPVSVLTEAALAIAPFALPTLPVKVSQGWVFKPGAGDAATLPLVALHVHARGALEGLPDLIAEIYPAAQIRMLHTLGHTGEKGGVGQEIDLLRRLFLSHGSLTAHLLAQLPTSGNLEPAQRERLAALVSAYGGPNGLFLNYYGPPRSIETISYHRILEADSSEHDLAGRVVFVGAAARQQPQQRDGFPTTYTQETGLNISGVEVAATLFANLLERRPVRPLAPGWVLLLLTAWALALTLALRKTPGGWIPVTALVAGGVYLGGAWIAFARVDLWVPLVTPLLIQLPVATFGGLLWRYREVQRQREAIRHAFGMHLPLAAVDQLARKIGDLRASTEHAFGTCLLSDAEQYTTLSERLQPAMLHQLMNAYYDALIPAVEGHGGVVLDHIGDAMSALWPGAKDRPESRRQACLGALDVLDAVESFNARNPGHRLPTRLGLHCGELVLGFVGAADRFGYRAVGDIVNTASRIEELNKRLGTRLLVSADVVSGLTDLQFRAVGRFLFRGKTRPVAICELTGKSSRGSDTQEALCAVFAEGLRAFTTGDWREAQRRFEEIEGTHGPDGPSGFYLRLCRRYIARPPEDWHGVVELDDE